MTILIAPPIIQYNAPTKEGPPLSIYAEKWWQLINSIPKDHNPLADQTGEWTMRMNAHSGIFFLAAGINQTEPFVRNVTVEYGRPIFFPILVGGYSEIQEPFPQNVAVWIHDQLNCLQNGICNIYDKLLGANHIDLIDVTKDLHFTIDGKHMPYHRVTTTPYNVHYSPENPFKVKEGSHTTVVDGYFAYIENLSLGNHTFLFGGHSPPDYFTTTIYNLEVI